MSNNTDNNFLMEPQILSLIAEFGKVTMSQCADTLSSILKKEVTIAEPKVETVRFQEVLDNLSVPKVSAVVEYKEGLHGTSILLMNISDAIVVADLMTGGNGSPENTEFTELQLSAVSEAMNQMTGSSITTLATMTGEQIDIFQPEINLWSSQEDVTYQGIEGEDFVSKVTYQLSVNGLIQSNITQIYTGKMIQKMGRLMIRNSEKRLEGSGKMADNQQEEQQNKKRKQKSRKVSVQQAEFDDLEPKTVESNNDNFDLLMDVPLDFSVVLGTSRKSIKDILSLGVGSVVELDSLTDEPLDIYVNSKLIAQGEVVVINENFGVRITSILSQKQRMKKLN